MVDYFLFNGIAVLPDIEPIWNKTRYPYACVFWSPNNGGQGQVVFSAYGFYVNSAKTYVIDKNYKGSSLGSMQTQGTSGLLCSCLSTDSNWSSKTATPNASIRLSKCEIVWSNCDITTAWSGGDVWLAAMPDTAVPIVAETPTFTQNLPALGMFDYKKKQTADTFSVTASVSGFGTLSYQWRKNLTPISGKTTQSYTPATSEVGSDIYDCLVTNTIRTGLYAQASSNSVRINVSENYVADDSISETALNLRSAFMLGLGTGASMSRTALSGKSAASTAAAVVASEDSGETAENIKSAYKSGFMTGLALYAFTTKRKVVFAEQNGETLAIHGAYSVVQDGETLEVT